MRVALDARALTWPTIRGITLYQFHLADELIKLGVEVTLIVEKNNFFLSPPKDAKIIEIPAFGPKKIIGLMWSQIALPQKLRRLPVDIYHATDNVRFPLFSPLPSTITIHDISPLTLPELSYNNWSFWSKISYKTHMLINKYSQAKIIAVSHATKNDLVRILKINPDKITVVHNGFTIPQTPKDDKIKMLLKKYYLREPYYLYIGGIEPRKNLIFLVKSFNQFIKETGGKEKLVIVGQTEKFFEARTVYQQITGFLQSPEGSTVKERVIFTGPVDEEEKGALLKKAIALIYPSLYEGFGLPPLEAASIGLPVITTRVAGIKEVSNKFALFVSPSNPRELVEAFNKIKNPYLRKRLIKAGIQSAKEFSWAKTAKKTLAIYESILKRSSGFS